MRIGFYAPLKTPLHCKPSGDREIGRLLLKALKALGHEVENISDLRSWEGRGCQERQKEIRQASNRQVKQLLSKYSKGPAPDLIFIYHVYHKAPDWIGIEVATAIKIPYVIAEVSFAPKQFNGPWHYGHQQTLRCIQQADRIIALNPADIQCLKPLVISEHRIYWLKPFLGEIPVRGDTTADKQKHMRVNNFSRDTVNLITVAMMRDGDKKASYRQLSDALKRLDSKNWRLIIIGDGIAADEIKEFFQGVCGECIFTGLLNKREIFNYLSLSDIFVWPAVNEAIGLALLEAQAFGLPAVAQDYGGVSTIVENNVTGYVTPAGNIDDFVFALKTLIKDSSKRQKMSRAAKHKFKTDHSFEVALKRLQEILNHQLTCE